MRSPVNHEQKPAQGASSKACVEKDRSISFRIIWRATHGDFRGMLGDGTLSLMSYAKFGGGLVTAATITDEELAERLAEARRAGGAK